MTILLDIAGWFSPTARRLRRLILITAALIALPLFGQTLGTLTAQADAIAEEQDADSLERDYVPPADCDDDDQRGC